MELNQKKSTKRHVFSSYEDACLKTLVEKYGESSWQLIAHFMPQRTPRQCRERYRGYLASNIKNLPWTREEDDLLIEKFQEYGRKWVKISKFFNGRSDSNVKNRWSALIQFNPIVKELNEKGKNKEHTQISDDDIPVPLADVEENVTTVSDPSLSDSQHLLSNINISKGSLVVMTLNNQSQQSNEVSSTEAGSISSLPQPGTLSVANIAKHNKNVKRHVLSTPLTSHQSQNSDQDTQLKRMLLRPHMFWTTGDQIMNTQDNALQPTFESYGPLYKNYAGKLW